MLVNTFRIIGELPPNLRGCKNLNARSERQQIADDPVVQRKLGCDEHGAVRALFNLLSIELVENGFDGVREENLNPLLDWLNERGVKSR